MRALSLGRGGLSAPDSGGGCRPGWGRRGGWRGGGEGRAGASWLVVVWGSGRERAGGDGGRRGPGAAGSCRLFWAWRPGTRAVLAAVLRAKQFRVALPGLGSWAGGRAREGRSASETVPITVAKLDQDNFFCCCCLESGVSSCGPGILVRFATSFCVLCKVTSNNRLLFLVAFISRC